MNLWGAAPLLAAVLLSGGHPGTRLAAPAVTPQPASIAATSADLTSAGNGRWQTTLLLNGAVALPCPRRSGFSLETTAPDKVIPADPGRPSHARTYCRRITLSFSGLNQIPASAVLVLRAPGAPVSAIPAGFIRPVSPGRYLLLPALAGLAMVVLLLVFALMFVKVYDWGGDPIPRPSLEFWRYTVTASGTWTVGDSWATNIAPIIGILATAFGVTTAASSVFPGVSLVPFEVVNLAAVAIIAIVPFVFSILYARWTAENPGLTADSTIVPPVVWKDFALTRAFGSRAVKINAPAGAVLTVPGGAAVARVISKEIIWASVGGAVTDVLEITHIGEIPKHLKDGATLQLPPGSKIKAVPGESITLPGASDLLMAGDSALEITFGAARLAIPADQFPDGKDKARGTTDATPGDTALASPVWILAPCGAKLTVNGAANVVLPADTEITAPRRRIPPLRTGRRLLIPQGSNTMVANMFLVIVSALMTIFGIGVQVGVAAVLAGYSDASPAGLGFVFALIAAVALFTLYYSTTAVRTLADPQPGSSLSAVSGTSFTL
jgi:hypothetical protein